MTKIKEENNYEMVLVVNAYRPETRDVEGVLQIIKEIEYASKIKFTAIVNNSNLGDQTDEEVILNSVPLINKVSEITGLKVLFTSVRRDLVEKINTKIENVLPIDPIEYGKWI